MIRRNKAKKHSTSSTKKYQAPTLIVHQSYNAIQSGPSENTVEVPIYENSYRLESKNPFNCTLVYDILKETVEKHCFGTKYDPVKCVLKVKTMANEILGRVKNLNFDRYRIIVYTQIGESKNQEYETVVRFLWDSLKDRFVTFNLSTGFLFAVVSCYGIYLD